MGTIFALLSIAAVIGASALRIGQKVQECAGDIAAEINRAREEVQGSGTQLLHEVHERELKLEREVKHLELQVASQGESLRSHMNRLAARERHERQKEEEESALHFLSQQGAPMENQQYHPAPTGGRRVSSIGE